MAASNWPACFRATLKHEGGWADHPRDPGGATMKGVTLATFRRYVPGASKSDLRNISDDMLSRIYREGYWHEVRGDSLPYGVDLVTYDAAVNSGPSRGAKWTQVACGAKADGRIGPKTLLKLQITAATVVVRKATDARLRFLQGLRTWSAFGKGWGRRVGEVRAMGLQMAGADRKDVTKDAKKVEKSADTDKAQSTAAGGGGVVTGGGATVDQAQGFDWTSLIGFGLVAAVLIGAAIFLVMRSRAKREASRAMLAHAAKMEG